MLEKIKAYKKKLEKCIEHYTDMNVNDSSAKCADAYMKFWITACEVEEKMSHWNAESLTAEQLTCWNEKMCNVDGTYGGHWPVDATADYMHRVCAPAEWIDPLAWNVAMNMMYSDFYRVAVKHGDNDPEWYADMAKAWLYDPDGPGPMKTMVNKYHKFMHGNK